MVKDVWNVVGYTLIKDDNIIAEMFKAEHPDWRGLLKIHPAAKDGFRKMEFKHS